MTPAVLRYRSALRAALWPRAPLAERARAVVYSRVAYPFKGVRPPGGDPRVAASFARYAAASRLEYMLHYAGGLLIEPVYGFALRHRRIIPESMPYHEQVGLPPLAFAVGGRRAALRVEALISLREFGDDNYYHFFGDILGRLHQLALWSLDPAVPVLVSPRLFARPYFQAALRGGRLAGRPVLVQQGWVEAGQAIFCECTPHRRAAFDFATNLMGAPAADPRRGERLLLTRRPERGRYLTNGAEVAALCAEHGFRCVDTDELTPAEQMKLFAGAGLVVGIHGAGLTNLIFRRGAPLRLLELFPADNIPPHYCWLCQSYGYGYQALVGTSPRRDGSFTVDLPSLREALREMLTAAENRNRAAAPAPPRRANAQI